MAQQSRNLLPKFGWETMHHPPYSPDLARRDFHVSCLRQALVRTLFCTQWRLQMYYHHWCNSDPHCVWDGQTTKYFNCQGDYSEKQWTTDILILCYPFPLLNKILPVIYGYCKLSLWSNFIKFKSGLRIILQLTKLEMGLTTIRIYHLQTDIIATLDWILFLWPTSITSKSW